MDAEMNLATKKKRRIEKQNRRRHPEISKKIILIWEELRQKNAKAERQRELCDNIMNLSKAVLLELIRQKVTARVFESVIEHGVDEHRWTIFEIVKNDLLELCKGKYSYFVIINMLKYGTKDQRLSVFDLMNGHIVDLLQHAYASKVVETAYNEFANAKQRSQMIQEFYGKTFALFKGEKEIKHLSEITNNSNYDMTILQNLHKVILPILRKGQVDMTIVQKVLSEYINVLIQARKAHIGDAIKPYEALLEEILELTHESILKLCNTREGTKVAMLLFYDYTTKMKKKVIQASKEVIVDLCTSENSHLFVMAILDQTDDTKNLDKFILRPIFENIDSIVSNIHGRKVIQFIIAHRDKTIFPKFLLSLLSIGDGNSQSKKDAAVRAQEILDFATKPMLKWLQTNIDESLKYSNSINIVTPVITKCLPTTDDLKKVYDEILEVIVQHIDEPIDESVSNLKRKMKDETKAVPKKKGKRNFTGKFDNDVEMKDETETPEEEIRLEIDTHLVESIEGQYLVKSLCKLEGAKIRDGFSKMCCEKISLDNLKTFINCNRTAFFLVFLYETGTESTQQFLKENFKELESAISNSTMPAMKFLSKHLFQ